MDARHCAGSDMAEMMAYAAAVGSARAKRKVGAVGFIGNATNETAHYFGNADGMGTMPHALVGYAGSTLRAAEMFHATFPDQQLIVLVDYFGREVTDALAVARKFPQLAADGGLGSGSIPPAAVTSKGSIHLHPTPSWSATPRRRCAAFAPTPSCAT